MENSRSDDNCNENIEADNAVSDTTVTTAENDNLYNDDHDYAEISECVSFSVASSFGDKANADDESSEPRYSSTFYEDEEEVG